MAQAVGNTSQSADEDALRNLLGLGSGSPRLNKPSPGPYNQSQQRGSPRANYPASNQEPNLSQSQRPRQPQQQPVQQPVIEPLAPRPQKMAQFDSLAYEAPVQQPAPSNNPQGHSLQYKMQPQHPPPPPHLVQHHHQHHQQQQHRQPPAPAPAQSQQQFVSAPLMPSVLLNKNQSSQPSPPSQARTVATYQSQPSSSHGGQQYGAQQIPQYSPSNPSIQKYGPPPVLRVKSPLSQSHTYGYASSDYSNSNSDVRFGAQSIPPPPVPPVESRPPHLQQTQQQPQQQQAPRQGSGGHIQQAISPRASPQDLSPRQAMDVLNETLKKTSFYQSQGPSATPGTYNRSAPVDRQTFRDYLATCLQVSLYLSGC